MNECAMVPAACRPNRRAASTLLVATNPTIAEARATAMAASTPWVRRKAKSTRSAPAAAMRQRAALDATAVWKVTWFDEDERARLGDTLGFNEPAREHHPPLRDCPHLPGEAQPAKRVEGGFVEAEGVPEPGTLVLVE